MDFESDQDAEEAKKWWESTEFEGIHLKVEKSQISPRPEGKKILKGKPQAKASHALVQSPDERKLAEIDFFSSNGSFAPLDEPEFPTGRRLSFPEEKLTEEPVKKRVRSTDAPMPSPKKKKPVKSPEINNELEEGSLKRKRGRPPKAKEEETAEVEREKKDGSEEEELGLVADDGSLFKLTESRDDYLCTVCERRVKSKTIPNHIKSSAHMKCKQVK